MSFTFDDETEKAYLRMLTQCVRANITPNYFARYALTEDISDPHALFRDGLTAEEIETAIKKLTAFWNKKKTNPRFERLLQQLLDGNSNARAILLDPEAQNRHKEKVRKEHERKIKERFKNLDETLKLLTWNGQITKKEFEAICKQLLNELSQDAIAERINERKIQIVESRGEEQEGDIEKIYPMLEAHVLKMNDIRKNLKVIDDLRESGDGKDLDKHQRPDDCSTPNEPIRTLYDFLGVTKNASPSEIQSAYLEKEKYWRQKRIDVTKTAAQDLLGKVHSYLLGGDRQKYDNSLLFEAMSKLDDQIEVACTEGILIADTFQKLVEMAATRGVEEKFARDYIRLKAKGYGAIAITPPPQNSGTVQCTRCYMLNDPSSEHCRGCGEPLYVTCPRCKRKVNASHSACTGCGCNFENIAEIRFLLEEARVFWENGNLDDALDDLRRARKLGEDTEKVKEDIARLEEEIRQRDEIIQRYEEGLYARRLYHARAELRKLRLAFPWFKFRDATVDELIFNLDQKIVNVENNLQKASVLEQAERKDNAIQAYEMILATCADCQEARKGLERCPPDPPRRCSTTYRPRVATIRWEKSPSVGNLIYHVVRKENSEPTSVHDGTTVVTTQNLTAEDRGGDVGHNYYYSIFTERNGVFSLHGTPAQSVLFYDDVKDFKIIPGDTVVEGYWRIEGNVKSLSVYKKEDIEPSRIGDGEEVPLVAMTQFVDKNVRNGQRYYYKIFSLFTDSTGQTVVSDGVSMAVTPDSPPSPLLEYTIKMEDSRVIITWEPLARGTVIIYKSLEQPTRKEGSIYLKSQLSNLGTPLTTRGRSAVDNASVRGICYYTPVTVEGDLGVIGRTLKFAFVDDVSDLTFQKYGSSNKYSSYIDLKWKWPQNSITTQVSWRHDTYPVSAEDTMAQTEIMSKAQYELKGGFRLNNPSPQPYYIKVFAGYRSGPEILYSPGVGIKVIQRTITYSIKKRFFGRYSIKFEKETDDEIPEIVLVAKKGEPYSIPLTPNQGTEIARISGQEDVVDLNASQLPRPCYIKAFFTNDAHYEVYHIDHPTPDEAYIK
jgi:hypothetical protein